MEEHSAENANEQSSASDTEFGYDLLNDEEDNLINKINISARVKYTSDYDRLLGVASILIAQNKHEEAQPILETIIDQDPGFIPAYQTLIDLYLIKNQHKKALQLKMALFDKGVKLSANELFDCAFYCVENQMDELALKCFIKASRAKDASLEHLEEFLRYLMQNRPQRKDIILNVQKQIFKIQIKQGIYDEQEIDLFCQNLIENVIYLLK
ncbi:MAG: hypothetical protein MHPSP_001851 [Paramarteilia canceri]